MENNNKEYNAKIVANWLKNYSNNVVVEVMKKYDEFINDKTTYTLLVKLFELENKEDNSFIIDIKNMIEYGVKNETIDCIRISEYSNSYRDVLYDLYIR